MLALLPTVELVEQGAHAVEHVVLGEHPDHDPHHDDHDPADEHGCTQLLHVCGSPHGFGLTPAAAQSVMVRHQIGAAPVSAPAALHDLAAQEPPHRPPIA